MNNCLIKSAMFPDALESALTASNTPTAPLRSRRFPWPIVGPPRLTPTPAPAVERRTSCPLAGLAHPQRPAAELGAVELLNRTHHGVWLAELNEGEPAGPIGSTIHRKDDLNDLTDLREQGFKIMFGRLVTEVSDKYSRRDREPPNRYLSMNARQCCDDAHLLARAVRGSRLDSSSARDVGKAGQCAP